jgi:peptide/nickel transport system substrate-binding protein
MHPSEPHDVDVLVTDPAPGRRVRLTRRHALRLFAGGAGLAMLTACAPQAAAPAPTPAPAKPAEAPKPTEAAKPAAPAATIAPAAPAAAAKPTEAAKPAAPAAAAAQPTVAAKPAEAARPAAPAKMGGTLRIATTADFGARGIDPHSISPTSFDTVWTVYDTLTKYDQKLQPQPMLAESWDVSSDFKQIKLNLRKGVQFHTGRELTSDDVKWNIERIKDPKSGAAQLLTMANWWSAIETPDKNTVILKSESPRPGVFDMLEYMNVADRVTMEGPDAATKAVGTGPFTYGEWVQGDHQRYVKNKSYWQSGKPYVDELYFQVMKDPQAATVQLEAGAVDALLNPTVRDLARLKADSKYLATINSFTGQHYVMFFNVTMPPFDKKEVRQAFCYAVDRKRFAESVLQGVDEPRDLPWPKHSPAYDAAKASKYTFDLEKAKSLLTAAGSPAIDSTINYSSSDYEPSQLAQIIQADFGKIGVKMSNNAVDTAQLQDMSMKVNYKGVILRFSGFAGTDPVTLVSTSSYWRAANNGSGFKSDTYTRLVQALGSEPDVAKRKQVISDLNDFLLDEAFVTTISSQTTSVVSKASVTGIAHTMHEAVSWTEASIG